MQNFDYSKWLLASDLDGTLLNSHHLLDKGNIDAVCRFTQAGGKFVVATGRSAQNVPKQVITELPINGVCILYNGAALYDFGTKKFIEKHCLNKAVVRPYIEELIKMPLVVEIYTPERMCIVSDGSAHDPQISRENQEHFYTHIDEIMNDEWLKFLVCGNSEYTNKAAKFAEKMKIYDELSGFFSSHIYIEFLKKGVNKGSGLKSLMNIERDRKVAAIGDFDNDAEMLAVADIGIAVANASEKCKAAARIITVDNDHCAVAEVIDTVIVSDI